MAFLQSVTTASPHVDNYMTSLQTFLLANGWTLFDTVAATDKVFRSTGTGRERIFIRFTKNANRIEVRAYQFWNVTANTGHNLAGGTGGVSGLDADDAAAFAFWMWTNGRAMVLATKVGATYNAVFAGSLDRVHDANIGFSTADVLAGASVVVALDQSFPSNVDWQIGKKLMILDQDSTHDVAGVIPAEQATVMGVGVGSVTLALAQNHKAGALVGVDPQPVCVTSLNVITQPRFTNHILGYSAPNGRQFNQFLPFDAFDSVIDPNDRTGRYLVQPIYQLQSSVSEAELRGKLPGIVAPGNGTIGNEDTTDITGAQYLALPIGPSGRQFMVPMF